MALTDIVTATSAGTIPWLPHDSVRVTGYWAVIDRVYRLDLVSGTYTLRKDGVTLDTQTDTDDTLKTAIESYISGTTSAAITDFLSKISTEA
jgi:hypothetical protein